MAIGTGTALLGAASAASSLFGKKGGGGQTTSSSSAPWEAQQPYLAQGFQGAQNLYEQNRPQYAPESKQTGDALGRIWQRASNGSPVVDAAKSSVTGMMNGDYSNPSTSYFNNIANNLSYQDNPASNYFEGAQTGQYLNSNPVNRYLNSTASGAFLNSNPYLDSTYDKAARSITRNYSQGVAPGVASSFERAGRYGSGLYQNAQDQAQENYAQGLGDLATNIYGNNYANERQNMIGAAGTIGNAYAGERQLQQGAASDLGNIYQQQGARSDAAANTLSNNYNTSRAQMLQAAALAPTLANQDYVDTNQLMNVGKTLEGYTQQAYDAPYTALQRYQQGITGNYGSSSSVTQPGQSPWGAIGQIGGSLFNKYAGGGFGGSGGYGGYVDIGNAMPWLS